VIDVDHFWNFCSARVAAAPNGALSADDRRITISEQRARFFARGFRQAHRWIARNTLDKE
jgi:hypothetical protein